MALSKMVAPQYAPRSKEHAANRVYEAIKERLLDGRYFAAEKLGVDAIAEEFGMSRFPVMDAMKRLSVEGFVNITPQVGCRVATFAAAEATDFFNLCMDMGGLIAELAAQRRTVEQLLALEEVMQEASILVERKGRVTDSRYRKSNRQYQLILHDMANSRMVTNLAENMMDKVDFMTSTSDLFVSFADSLERRYADLETLREAIVAKDSKQARRAYKAQLATMLRKS